MRRWSWSILVLLLVALLLWLGRGILSTDGPSGGAVVTGTGASRAADPSPTLSFQPLHFGAEVEIPQTNAGSSRGISPFRVISCTPEETVLEFTLPEYFVTHLKDEEGVAWNVISAEGAESMDVAGKPSLPVYLLAYGAVPGSAVQAELRDVVSETLSDCRPLPGRGPYLRTQEPPELVPSEEAYGADCGVYPAENAGVVSSYQIRGIQGSGIVFSPCQYDSCANAVRVVTRCTVVLRSESSDAAVLDSQSDFAQMQSSMFVNSSSFRSEGSSAVGNLSILVPDVWLESEMLSEFVAWKKSVGWHVELTGYPSETGEGRDEILAWSRKRYKSGMTHLLLLGDYDVLPPYQHGAKGWGDTGEEREYQYVASDTGYALLSGEDDLSYMDVFMGRMPVSDQDSLEHALRASMYYEQGAYQSDDWTQKAVYIGSAYDALYWPYAPLTDKEIIHDQAEKLDAAGIILLEESKEQYAKSEATDGTSASTVVDALNAGVSVLMYLGHGTCTQFSTTKFGSANAKALSNQGKLPFVMAPVCYTGNLDHYNVDYDYAVGCPAGTLKCLGQSFFVNKTDLAGIAGGVFASHEAYWNPPIKQLETFTEDLEKYRSDDRLATQGAYAFHALDAAVQFCDTYADEYPRTESHKGGNGGYTTWTGVEHAWIMEFLGDPSCVLRIGPQAELAAQWELQAEGGAKIKVMGFDGESSCPVPNCAVCVKSQEGTVICSGRTDSEGVMTVEDASELFLGAFVCLLDGSGPYQEQRLENGVDADNNGVVTNQEMSCWLAGWQKNYNSENANASAMLAVRDRAIAEWQAKPDMSEETETEGTESKTSSRAVTIVPEENIPVPYEEIRDYMSSLCHDHWPSIRPTVIGTSVKGTPMMGVRISLTEENSDVPHLLLLAGAHGDESEAVKCAKMFLETLERGVTGEDQGVQGWLESNVIWVVPVLNPDGYSAGTKENAKGVDLEDGFPWGCGTLSAGDPTGLYENWEYADETSHLPEVEQKAFVRWMVAHHINTVMMLRQDVERYVSCAGEQSMELAYFLADFGCVVCKDDKAGALLNWCAEYLGCQALMFAASDADDGLFEYLQDWITNSASAPSVDTAERLYLPGHEREIAVVLTDAGQTPVLRVKTPSEWTAACRDGKCVGVRSGTGYADVVLMDDSELQKFSLSVTADEDFERETRLEFVMDTPEAQSTWFRVMVAATRQETTEVSVAAGWNALAVPIAGITPASLGVTEAYIWKNGAFAKVSPESFQPGVSYWVNCPAATKVTLPGLRVDAKALSLKKGMQFLGTTTSHVTEATLYGVKDGVFQMLPPEDGMPAGQAVWMYLPEDAVVVP